jgi:hypothetical protein
MTKLENHISCFQECKRVWGNEPSHSQVNSHFENWNPNGFPNFQRAIAGVKTHWIENLFISLESSWNVDVWNGLTWPIWTPKHKLWTKERLGVKLEFDSRPLKVGNRPDFLACKQRATYRWKFLMRATTLLQTSLRSVYRQSYEPPNLRKSQLREFWDSHLGVLGQNAIWMLVPWLAIEYS